MTTIQVAAKDEPVPTSPLPMRGRVYKNINTQWPETVPPLTGQEAISATKRLWRLATGKAYRGKFQLTSGNRYSYPRSGVFYVNPERGWQRLVHDLSHAAHQRVHPSKRPHHWLHGDLERRMAEMVITKGWLEGKLRRDPKPKPDIRLVREQRIQARIATWERKLKRAENALRKLRRQERYYSKNSTQG